MSGFEIAGIVLGALPVIDEGLSYFSARSKELIHYEDVMTVLILKMHEHQVRFRRVCERLLASFTHQYQVEMLLDRPSKDIWVSVLASGLRVDLEKKLGYSHHVFVGTWSQIAHDLAKLRRRVIGLDKGQVSKEIHSTFRRQRLTGHCLAMAQSHRILQRALAKGDLEASEALSEAQQPHKTLGKD